MTVEMLHKDQFETISEGLIVNAPAKINLSLLIAGKRPDGFHEIETIMSKVSWYDQVKIEHSKHDKIELVCEGPQWAPNDESNLVFKAAKLILEYTKSNSTLKISLYKNIPAGTGLGSASSDAAATLLGINRLLKLGLSDEQLCLLGSKLGSDIPFFLGPELAYCRGRGEKISKIDKKISFHCLIIMPDISVSTAEVYKNYKHNSELYKELSGKIHPHIEKKNIDLIIKMCANMLQQSCFEINGELARLKNDIASLGTSHLCLSGSGSALYILFDSKDTTLAKKYQEKLMNRLNCKSVLVYNNRW